ncbi:S1C family serine protease [Auraticoccus monumenti]|uniref:Putative serine protease PepD n=1 Tax=Auraticoccus monumenti TaxID=675864 RepID=A0A1G6UVD6_9ACTN|nr:trypsin-like peptidase domain-containing protein [Auraticoccus monumenti]SDD45350.1 putative serine protease PepD [Auraticoccus monumenti]
MDDETFAQNPTGTFPDGSPRPGDRPAASPDLRPSGPGWPAAGTPQPSPRPGWAATPDASLGESAPAGSGAPGFHPAAASDARGFDAPGFGGQRFDPAGSGAQGFNPAAVHSPGPAAGGHLGTGPGVPGFPYATGPAGSPHATRTVGTGATSGAFGVPAATAPAAPGAGTAVARRPRLSGVRATAAAVAMAALVGAGTGIGGYAVLDQASPAVTSPISVDGGAAPISAQLDGTVGAAADVIAPSTVTIEVRGSQSSGLGTGVVLDTEGHVLTNEHVVAGGGQGAQIRVTLDDGRTAAATVVGQSSTTDLAVIQLDGSDLDLGSLTPATFATSDSVSVGQTVVAVGAPLGLSDTVTSGVVSNTARPVRSGSDGSAVYQAVQTDAAINPGNSGGPLVDLDGRVVGINSSIASTAGSSGEQAGNIGIGFAIPADVASRVAGEIVETGSSTDASLGVALAGTDSATGSTGATVQTVQPGSAAEAAGLQPGDVVTQVQGVPTGSADALIAAVRYWAPGTTVTLTYERDGETSTTDATLGAA